MKLISFPFSRRLGGSNIHGNNVESLVASKTLVGIGASEVHLRRPLEIADLSSRRTTLYPACTGSYERELPKLVLEGFEKDFAKPEEDNQGLPQWLRVAKASSGGGTSEASCAPLQVSSQS